MTTTKADFKFIECAECNAGFEVKMYHNEITGNSIPTQRVCSGCLSDYEIGIKEMSEAAKPINVPSNVSTYDGFDPMKLPGPIQALFPKLADRDLIKKGIGLLGPTNVGKSWVLFELARRVETSGRRVAVVQDHLINDIVLPENKTLKLQLQREIDHADLILWDDFGTAGMTDAVEKFLNRNLEAINKRKIPILGSCNYSGGMIKQLWSDHSNNSSWMENRGEKLIRRFRRDSDWYRFDEKEQIWK